MEIENNVGNPWPVLANPTLNTAALGVGKQDKK
jgi:hypothetical protein